MTRSRPPGETTSHSAWERTPATSAGSRPPTQALRRWPAIFPLPNDRAAKHRTRPVRLQQASGLTVRPRPPRGYSPQGRSLLHASQSARSHTGTRRARGHLDLCPVPEVARGGTARCPRCAGHTGAFSPVGTSRRPFRIPASAHPAARPCDYSSAARSRWASGMPAGNSSSPNSRASRTSLASSDRPSSPPIRTAS